MKAVRSAATIAALVLASPVMAKMEPTISCAEFVARFEVANVTTGRKLPTLQLKRKANGDLEIVNVENVHAVVGCTKDGGFKGIGASLLSNEDVDIDRFSYFSNAAVMAMDSKIDVESSISFLKKLSMDALIAAQNTKIKSGQLHGSAEANLGNAYYARQTFTAGLVRMGIELRSED